MAKDRLPVIRRFSGTLAVAPYVPVTLGVGLRALGLDEPGMLVGSVVHHHVHDDADLPFFGFGYQAVEIRHGAVLGIDRLVVGDVVAEIYLGRGIDGREPDGVDSEVLEVIEALGDPVEVADTVVNRRIGKPRNNRDGGGCSIAGSRPAKHFTGP